ARVGPLRLGNYCGFRSSVAQFDGTSLALDGRLIGPKKMATLRQQKVAHFKELMKQSGQGAARSFQDGPRHFSRADARRATGGIVRLGKNGGI
ncbi:unnamed protein product, partial [Prorocentrum cordatum]